MRTVFNDSFKDNYNLQIDDCIIKTLNDWGYDLKLYQTVGSLSGGQKQAFTLARALRNKPNLFVLDEPISAIDFKRKLQILKSLKQINQAAFTLISSHDINDAISIADTIIVFNEDLKP
ncbi:MAG: ATP-binding cassette domain-containing protein [Saprospiraceae bacterium]|nr:ATP-binding cassette domain-containing protein [Saprospiraceae bacterium]